MRQNFFCLGALLLAGSLWAGDNELSATEKAEGWQLLFDGKSTKGWMSPKGKPISPSHVHDGSLNPHPCDYMLTHESPWENFRLALDFRITPKCNSGVFLRTFPLTTKPGKDVGFNGLEIAIDDTQTAGYHDTGALYDLSKPKFNAMKPVGQWNHLELDSEGPMIVVHLNGTEVNRVNLDLFSEPYLRPDGSKHKFDTAFKNHPRRGYIGLQDHGSNCWYKNIKIQPKKS
jgi:hypothetical protein